MDTNAVDYIQQFIHHAVSDKVQRITNTAEFKDAVASTLETMLQQEVKAKVASLSLTNVVRDAVSSFVVDSAPAEFKKISASCVSDEEVDRHFAEAVKQAVDATVASIVDNPNWVTRVQNILAHDMTTKLYEKLTLIDFNHVIAAETRRYIKERHEAQLPNAGIVDRASSVQLSVIDDHVVVESKLVAYSAKITGHTEVERLTVNGALEIGSFVDWSETALDELVRTVIKKLSETVQPAWQAGVLDKVATVVKNTPLSTANLHHGNTLLVRDNTLAPAIQHSKLTSVGQLSELSVAGDTALAGKTFYASGKRVGINTQNPDMALTVWDDDVAVSLGKISEGVAYIGTSRVGSLAIGINHKKSIEISPDGEVKVAELRVGSNLMKFSGTQPNWSGTQGDIVWNSKPAAGTPFAWQCWGGARWKGLKTE